MKLARSLERVIKCLKFRTIRAQNAVFHAQNPRFRVDCPKDPLPHGDLMTPKIAQVHAPRWNDLQGGAIILIHVISSLAVPVANKLVSLNLCVCPLLV